MRRSSTILILLSFVVLGLMYWRDSTRLSPGQDLVALTDYAKEAIEFKRQQINALAQLAILLIGALWALIIGAKAVSPPLTGRLWVVFGSANVSLGVSYFLYLKATDQLIEYLLRAKNIDLYSPKVSLYSSYQIITFSVGLTYAVMFALLFYLQRREES